VETLLLDVGIVDLVDEPVFGGLGVDVAGSGGNRLVEQVFARGAVAVRQLPGIQQSGGIFAVPDHAATIEHQGFQAVLGELLGGPTAGDAGPDHDGLECVTVHRAAAHPYSSQVLGPLCVSRPADRAQVVEVDFGGFDGAHSGERSFLLHEVVL